MLHNIEQTKAQVLTEKQVRELICHDYFMEECDFQEFKQTVQKEQITKYDVLKWLGF